MTKEEKLRMLQALSEKDLTKQFLIPLFESDGMGCKSVRYTHRRLEFGKDVVYYKEDEFGNRVYTGAQVKKTRIRTGDVDGLLRQTTEAFGEPFTDLSDGKKRDLDRFAVVTSNEFIEDANQSFRASLRGAKLDRLVTCIDGKQLVELLDKYLPSAFWDKYDYFNRYFNAMRREFMTIKDVSAIGQREAVSLEKIYVSLRVSEERKEREMPAEEAWKIFDDKKRGRKELEGRRGVEMTKVVDADRAVGDYKRLVVVGDPGSGKTTLLKHLALKWCRENMERQERASVPIPIVLRELAEKGNSIRTHIDDVFERYDFPNAKKWIERDLKAGNCRLLLDGFDELATAESQEEVAAEVERFVKKYGKNAVVVTSRTAGYHGELKGFAKAELMEFDDEQIGRFIENWFAGKDAERGKSMHQAVKANEQIKAIARNPLMVAIIAIIYEEDRRLPERRADLYERCVQVLLSKWDVQKRLKNRYAADKKEFILRKVAFYGHTNNKRIMTQEEIRGVMLGHFSQVGVKEADFEPFLDEIWQRSFLLRQVSMGSYDFLHLSFQEYFTGLELTKSEDGVSMIIKHLGEPWWEEPILLYAGIKKDASSLIGRIRDDVPEDIFCSNLMLCGKCAADAEFTKPAVKERLGAELYELCIRGEFGQWINRAGEVLGRMKPEKIIERAAGDLATGEGDVRRRAASALGQIGGEKAVEALLEALRDKDSYVRWRAADALGRIGGEKAVEALLEALRDKESDVRGSAAFAMGQIGGEKAVEPLKGALKDVNINVRDSAFEALEAISRREGIRIER